MTRRSLLTTALAVPALAQNRRGPNVIVLSTDDHGSADLGCYGAKDLQTPHFDALAHSGARFTNWYSNAPVCAPSRASLMTGRYPGRAGVPTNGPALAPAQRTIASLLKPRGYRTGCVGKWHLGYTPETVPNAHGFNEFYGFLSGCVDFYSHRYYWGEPRQPNYHDLWRNRTEIFEDGQYLTDRLGDEAVAFIERHRAEPFFLYVPFNAPHYPMHAPPKYMDRFQGLPLERRTYAAMIAGVDDQVGRIMGALDRLALRNDTLVVWMGDNGATTEARAGLDQQPATAGSNGGYRGYKFSLFDGGMHVPGVMSWPGRIAAGQVIPEVVMTMDVLPTILAATGATLPTGYTVDGVSILPVAAAQAKSPHGDGIFWQQGQQAAVRRGPWKLVVNGATHDRSPESKKPLTGENAVFLSNLDEDPGETRNRRRQHAGVADELMTLLARWQPTQAPPAP